MDHFFRGLSNVQSKCHEKRFEEKATFRRKKSVFFWISSEKSPVLLQISGSVVRTTLNLSGEKSGEIIFSEKITFFSPSSKLEEKILGFNKKFFATTFKAALDGSTKTFGGFFLLLSLIKNVFNLFQTSSKKIGF